MSRQRDRRGKWGIWYLVSNREQRAQITTQEYAHRFGCEEGFRDAKWWLGFKAAHIQAITAWSRLFALFALALLVVVSLGVKLLLRRGCHAWSLLRRVVSRRRKRCELSLVSAVLSLLQADKGLLVHLCPNLKFDLEAKLPNVS